MSRVHCLECGAAVVVDPSGMCPEGHLVGSAGVRVAQAMGGGSPHPDEPEPWVATVVLDEVASHPAPAQRTIRPVPVAGGEEFQRDTDDVDHESMLRELHALGDLHDAPPSGPAAQATSARPSTPVSDGTRASVSATPPAVADAPPPREQFAEGLAELSALEAAFHALGYDEEATPDDGPDHGQDHGSNEGPNDAGHGGGHGDPPTTGGAAAASPAAGTAPPAHPAPMPGPPLEAETAPADDDAGPIGSGHAPARDAQLDLANFTAHGAKVGTGRGGRGGRRRLFGR